MNQTFLCKSNDVRNLYVKRTFLCKSINIGSLYVERMFLCISNNVGSLCVKLCKSDNIRRLYMYRTFLRNSKNVGNFWRILGFFKTGFTDTPPTLRCIVTTECSKAEVMILFVLCITSWRLTAKLFLCDPVWCLVLVFILAYLA